MRETHILETKNVGLYTWRGGGRGSEKVYCVYTHENVDIFGRPRIQRFIKVYIHVIKYQTHSFQNQILNQQANK